MILRWGLERRWGGVALCASFGSMSHLYEAGRLQSPPSGQERTDTSGDWLIVGTTLLGLTGSFQGLMIYSDWSN